MGLFSKKLIICERCGKEFYTRLSLLGNICDECIRKENEKREHVRGYVNYASDLLMPQYNAAQLDDIANRRTRILEKYRQTEGISKSELQNASDHYNKLTDEQAADVLTRIANSSITSTCGAAYTGQFFIPTIYDKLVVDAEDVFAVGYTSDYKMSGYDSDVILCAVFTNDPYIPVFPMVYVGKIGFFEVMKSKKGRQGVAELFELMCPNLTYPVQELNKLKKQIKAEGGVKGNIDLKFMLNNVSNACDKSGIFKASELSSYLSTSTASMLDEYGYIHEDEINRILKMDKMFNKSYWKKQMKRLAKCDMND